MVAVRDAVATEELTGYVRLENCIECSRVCPTGVYPARHIEELRRTLRNSHH